MPEIRSIRSSGPPAIDFEHCPFLAIWEITRACDLACVHCRAAAIPERDPAELSTEEGYDLLEQIKALGGPLVIITGGDPMRRQDVFDLVRHGTQIGLRMAMTPSGTPLITEAAVVALQEAGLCRLAVSLDGADAVGHDGFRRVKGSFDWSLDIMGWARRHGLSTQVNTTITQRNIDEFDALAELVGTLGIGLWSIFFVVPTGRAQATDVLPAAIHERLFQRIASLAERSAFDLKTTAAPHYRRFLLQRRESLQRGGRAPDLRRVVGPVGTGGLFLRAAPGVNDAKGLLFVSHTGEVYPSGFLPLSAGNIRRQSLAVIYRQSSLFRTLRDYRLLKGKCGCCEYRDVCGGSRARAYAMTGDIMESDPFCSYVPEPYRDAIRQGEAEAPHLYFRRRIEAHLGGSGLAPLGLSD